MHNSGNIQIIRANSKNESFQELVKLLDADLAIRDGDDHDFYHQFNGIDQLNQVVVVFQDEIAVACGAFKPYNSSTVEIKRMYTHEEFRGQGFASIALAELEKWAGLVGFETAVLETGIKQPEAINLYGKLGYHKRENYGPYAGLKTSVCFSKKLV